jgi:hypothetical protein
MICQAVALLLLVSSKLLQLIKRHLVQRLLICSVQEDLRNNLRAQWVVLVRIESLSPSTPAESVSCSISLQFQMIFNSPANTETPLATSFHARNGT